ncbi:hypothetical protein [Paenibacillus sp. FJAT-26967]|uniref:hypothetical protein n=1 Tax=Paenibacillus sp. FJAT-26967 TaxID=1729690 RepID=UPI000A88C1FB|nr:hypothetical protein [Paenibacillus sp. FJAT-26967]
MKITITQNEALEKGVWQEVMNLFGLNKEDDVWPSEAFVLTEEQARELGLIR